jgi:hypothetical protein
MKKSALKLVVLLTLTAMSLPALASGSLRCGTKLVEQGMSKEDVVKICGEPTTKEKYDTVWIYDRNPSEMLKVLTFVNGEVEFIDEHSREIQRD